MNQPSISPALLRGIAILYCLLFLTGLCCSAWFLKGVIELRPIPLIGLLKYVLLSVLFLTLTIYAVKAMDLHREHLRKLSVSTRNFKWLFLIALLISIPAISGFFGTAVQQVITAEQIAVLLILGIFTFWSDRILMSYDQPVDETEGK